MCASFYPHPPAQFKNMDCNAADVITNCERKDLLSISQTCKHTKFILFISGHGLFYFCKQGLDRKIMSSGSRLHFDTVLFNKCISMTMRIIVRSFCDAVRG